MNNTNTETNASFSLRILSAVVGFPRGGFIVEDGQKSVFAVRGGDRESAVRYASGIDAMTAQAFCKKRGVETSIVASAV